MGISFDILLQMNLDLTWRNNNQILTFDLVLYIQFKQTIAHFDFWHAAVKNKVTLEIPVIERWSTNDK